MACRLLNAGRHCVARATEATNLLGNIRHGLLEISLVCLEASDFVGPFVAYGFVVLTGLVREVVMTSSVLSGTFIMMPVKSSSRPVAAKTLLPMIVAVMVFAPTLKVSTESAAAASPSSTSGRVGVGSRASR
jgi:hypothetical protein